MKMEIAYVDGQYLPRSQAQIPVDDLAVLRGYAAWDIMRTYNGRPYFLEAHVDRLFESAEKIGLDLPWTKDEICEVVRNVMNKNPKLGDANLRILATGGSSPDYFSPSDRPRLIVLPTEIPKLPEKWYTDGIKVVTHEAVRAIPDAKVTDYVQAALALKKARNAGAVDAIYISPDAGKLALEATTSNLFAFIDATLVTPDTGILQGITRKTVIRLAQPHFTIAERSLPLTELLNAREVFITGTNKGVVPVVQIDDTIIGNGTPGPDTRILMNALTAAANQFKESR